MAAHRTEADPADVVRALFEENGPSDSYDVSDVDVTGEGDRIEIRFAAANVNFGIAECLAHAQIVGEYELNPDGDDAYRTLVIARADGLVAGRVAVLDALHTCGEYTDDDHTGYLSGSLVITTPERAERELLNALGTAERRAAAAIADSLRACLRRMSALDDASFRDHHLQEALRATTRHMAERL